MKPDVVLFLRDWNRKSLKELKHLNSFKGPIVVLAHELQSFPEADQFLSMFQSDQLQILSTDVDLSVSSLKEVFLTAEKNNWTHVLSMQGTCPPLIERIPNLLAVIKQAPQSLIFFVDEKQIDQTNSVLMQRLLDLGDSDYRRLVSPFNVYPVKQMAGYPELVNDEFDEVRILIHSLRNHLSFKEVVLASVPDSFSSETKKTLKTRFFDWWLIALSSLHRDPRPAHSAASFALGAFLACTPFYGLQTGLIILFSALLRLSFPIAFLGSQISLPPLYSLLVPLQIYVGAWLTGQNFDLEGSWATLAQRHFMSWMWGSLTVGLLVASIMGVLWFWVQTRTEDSCHVSIKEPPVRLD